MTIADKILEGLNEKQKELVKFKDGYCISSSTSGSGKTESLVRRVEYMVKVHKIPEEEIVMMTFTKSAVETFKKRLRKVGIRNVKVGTIHSLAYGIYIKEYGNKNNLIPEWKIEKLFYNIYKSKHGDNNDKFDFNTILLAIGQQEAHMIKWSDRKYVPYEQTYMELPQEELRDYYKAYVQLKKDEDLISFNDMIYEAIKILKQKKKSPYNYLLGDEYMDSSKLCYAFMDLLSPKNQLICGHASQSIFAFSGADLNSFINYTKTHKPCSIINLSINYRSKNNIVENYNRFESYWYGDLDIYEKAIANDKTNGIIRTFEVEDNTQEAQKVLDIIKDCRNRGMNYSDIKILYRNNSQAGMVETFLKEKGIPYEIINNASIFDLKEIQCILNILRLINDEEDDLAVEKLLETRQGSLSFVSKDTIKSLINFAHKNECTILEAMQCMKYTSSRTKQNIYSFLRTFETIKDNYYYEEDVCSTMEEIYKRMGIENRVKESNNEKDLTVKKAIQTILEMSKEKNINQVINMLSSGGETKKTKIRGLAKRNTDKVLLETLHQSKGQESKVIIMIGVKNDIFTYDAKKKDRTEINCFFVGISRAKEELYIISDYDNKFVNIMLGEK